MSSARAGLTMYFDQSAYAGDVWLQVQDPFYNTTTSNFQATYDGGSKSIDFTSGMSQTLLSAPVKLSDIGSGGLDITFSESAVFYIFYDDPTSASRTAPQNQMTSTLRFMPYEVTWFDVAGNQGNLTAINYFTAPLGMKSYQNDPKANPMETPLQSTGFNQSTAQIASQLDAAAKSNPSAVVKNGGEVVRYLGPSNAFSGTNPYPSFVPYAQAVNAAGQSTHIERANGFNFAAPDNTPVYQFGADMQATMGTDGTITMSGNITVSANTAVKPGNPAIPGAGFWSDATITISATDVNMYNNAIYGQAANSAVTPTGTAWSEFETFTMNTLMDPGQPHNNDPSSPDYNPSLYDLGAYSTTYSMFIGEITTALLGGFVNSDYVPPVVNGSPNTTPIKDLPSNTWWSLDPIVGYSEIQPDDEYYNTYADVIFDTSNNTVYGVPFSDRFGTGPLVDTVSHNGNPVNYLVIEVGAPVPEPGTWALLGAGGLMWFLRRRFMPQS